MTVTITLDLPDDLAAIIPDVAAVLSHRADGKPIDTDGKVLETMARTALAAAGDDIRFSPEVALTLIASNICDEVANTIFEYVYKAVAAKA